MSQSEGDTPSSSHHKNGLAGGRRSHRNRWPPNIHVRAPAKVRLNQRPHERSPTERSGRAAGEIMRNGRTRHNSRSAGSYSASKVSENVNGLTACHLSSLMLSPNQSWNDAKLRLGPPMTCPKLSAAASAFHGVPSWKRTPRRRVNTIVYSFVTGSIEDVQLVASAGATPLS